MLGAVPAQARPPCAQVEVIGGADKYQAVCRRCYFGKTLAPCGQPAVPDREDKENCPVLRKPEEAGGCRKSLFLLQALQCSPTH